MNTDDANLDSKPAALPVPRHPARLTGNSDTAVGTRNGSSVAFGSAITRATNNMITIGMIDQCQKREMVVKFRREVKASLIFQQLLDYHAGSSPSVQESPSLRHDSNS